MNEKEIKETVELYNRGMEILLDDDPLNDVEIKPLQLHSSIVR